PLLVLLLPASVNPRLAGLCSLKHACADLSHQRAQICLSTNQHIFPSRVNRHIFPRLREPTEYESTCTPTFQRYDT
ncbi:hypothetical protein BGX38DRAFT_1247618, partial [Terfezia claveryi]